MILNKIIQGYRISQESTKFLLDCKKKGIKRQDIEDCLEPEFSDEFDSMGQEGEKYMKDTPIWIAAITMGIYRIFNYSKSKEAQKYFKENLLPKYCTIPESKD